MNERAAVLFSFGTSAWSEILMFYFMYVFITATDSAPHTVFAVFS